MDTRKFTLTTTDEKERLQLPVSPQQFSMKTGMNNNIVEIQDLGEINLIGNRILDVITLESFFPAKVYNFCTIKSFPSPYECISILKKWRDKKEPIKLIITETDINHAMTIESFEYREQDGTRDVYFTLELKEYRFLNVYASDNNVINEINKATSLKNRPNNPPEPAYYVMKSGDTLWALAKKYLGDGKKWTILANKNGITNERTIPIGKKIYL